MKRVMCLYLPFLAIQRWQKQADPSGAAMSASADRSALSGQALVAPSAPIASITNSGQTVRIVHCNRAAEELRIHPGQTLSDAKAIAPGLMTFPDDPGADQKQIEQLAIWADRFSPVVHIEDANTLFVDISGGELLFPSEPLLLQQAVAELRQGGFTARGAIADTPGAAWALAHAHPDFAIVAPPQSSAMCLAPLPVWSLRVEPGICRTLECVGVETIEALLHLPRSSLVARFGQELLDRIDQALGELEEILVAYRPTPALTARIEWEFPTDRRDLLARALRRALDQFCADLAARAAGVREVFTTFSCPGVPVGEQRTRQSASICLSLSQATRSAARLDRFFGTRLECLPMPGPADCVSVWSRHLEPLDAWQRELFDTDQADAGRLADLVDRLSVALGREAITRPQLLDEHAPEGAFRCVAAVEKCAASSPPPRVDRPLSLLRRPLRVAVVALVPEGPPVSFRINAVSHAVVAQSGPERIETGWWRGRHMQRDYYCVDTDTGRRGWLFRDRVSREWFLHGWFD